MSLLLYYGKTVTLWLTQWERMSLGRPIEAVLNAGT